MPKVAAPQDRKVKVSEEIVVLPEETPGWDLMKPIEDVPVWDQIPLVATLFDSMDAAEKAAKDEFEEINAKREAKGLDKIPVRYAQDAKGKIIKDDSGDPIPVYEKAFDPKLIGELAKAILPFARDEAELTKFMSGKGAIERTAALAMAWVGQMGESSGSDEN